MENEESKLKASEVLARRIEVYQDTKKRAELLEALESDSLVYMYRERGEIHRVGLYKQFRLGEPPTTVIIDVSKPADIVSNEGTYKFVRSPDRYGNPKPLEVDVFVIGPSDDIDTDKENIERALEELGLNTDSYYKLFGEPEKVVPKKIVVKRPPTQVT